MRLPNVNTGFKLIIPFLLSSLFITSSASSKPLIQQARKHTQAGINLYRNDQLELARREFIQALTIDKKNVVAHEFMAQIFLKEKNFVRAREFARNALALNPKSTRAHYVLGMIFLEEGKTLAARDELRKAFKSANTPEEKKKAEIILQKLKRGYGKKLRDSQRKEQLRPGREPWVGLRQKKSVDKGAISPKVKPRVAVFTFEDTNVRTERMKLGETLSEMLTTALIQLDSYEVMERVQLQKILEEQALGQSGALDSETAVEIGKISGLEAIIVGSISQLKTVVEADARLIEVETGRALAAVNSRAKSIDQVRDLAEQLAKGLAAKASLVKVETETEK